MNMQSVSGYVIWIMSVQMLLNLHLVFLIQLTLGSDRKLQVRQQRLDLATNMQNAFQVKGARRESRDREQQPAN